MSQEKIDTKRLNVDTKATFPSTCTVTDAATKTVSGTVTESGTFTQSGTRTVTGTQTIGAAGVLNFTGSGYMDRLGHIRNYVEFFDDFTGDLIDDAWGVQADTGGSALTGTVPGKSGILTLTTDATDDDTVIVAHDLNWFASQGGLLMEVKLKIDVITTLAFFVGFTDARVEASPNLPIGRQTTVSAATATDAVGFVFDTDSTTDVLFGSGVKAGTLIADQGATTIVAATYVTLRVEVSSAGAASFYVDNVQIGATTAAAVTTTVALCPMIAIANRGSAAHVASVDYAYCRALRA